MAKTGQQVNGTKLALFLGVALPTIDAMVRRGRPVVKRGTGPGREWTFDTAALVEWVRVEAAANAGGDASKATLDELEAQAPRQDGARRDRPEERQGELMPIDLVVREWTRTLGNVRSRLLALPSKLAGPLVGMTNAAEIHAEIEAGVHEALEELADTEATGGIVGGATVDVSPEEMEADPEAPEA